MPGQPSIDRCVQIKIVRFAFDCVIASVVDFELFEISPRGTDVHALLGRY
jgi:hypothetical protein